MTSPDYNTLIKSLKTSTTGFRPLKAAVLADFASQHLVKALRAAATSHRIELTVWEAEYDTIATTVYDFDSELYQQPFDYIFIFYSPLKLYKEFSYTQDKRNFAAEKLATIRSLASILQERTRAKLILSNIAESDDALFGNYANKTPLSFLYQVRHLNTSLMDLAVHENNLFILDVQNLFCWRGRTQVFNPKFYIHADLVFDLGFLALMAVESLKIIAALEGSFKKCVILDLDNTLWGGIIGDDGLENIQIGDLGLGKAFSALQTWLHNLKERGIILAVCSKNTEAVAKEVFIKHPNMGLRLSDISVFVANWETKVDNILFIQSILNIGFDSMVFLDDNPFERSIVRENIAGITVPELPEDPAEYLSYLQSLNLFETASVSEADSERTKQYQEEAGRVSLQKQFTSEAEFLSSLNMVAEVKPFDQFSCPRVAQLTQRSNQFNLRTVRYTEQDVCRQMVDDNLLTLSVSLKDKFGDYGLISVLILEKKEDGCLFIDTWIMSCRVLKRGVEHEVLNHLTELAIEHGFNKIVGEYLPTVKNALVKDHYKTLGFTPSSIAQRWELDVPTYEPKQTFINKLQHYAIYE